MGRRNKLQRALDDQLIVELFYVKRLKRWEIADHITTIRPYSLGLKQVGVDLKRIEREWQSAMVETVTVLKRQELERLEQLEREYWAQFELSKTGRDGKAVPANPEFLEGIERCIGLRAKLLGLEAPKAMAVDVTVSSDARISVLAKVEALAAKSAELYKEARSEDYSSSLELPGPLATSPSVISIEADKSTVLSRTKDKAETEDE